MFALKTSTKNKYVRFVPALLSAVLVLGAFFGSVLTACADEEAEARLARYGDALNGIFEEMEGSCYLRKR